MSTVVASTSTSPFKNEPTIRTEKTIIWRDGKTDINNEWWSKEGIIEDEIRFKLFCDKNVKIFLTAGYRKASQIIRPIKVEYLEPRRGKHGRRVYHKVYGIWDGEKAVFKHDLDRGTKEIVVRNFNWIKEC